MRWVPWKWMIRRAARSYGLVDPFTILARLRRFAEPSEVDAPLELIRAWTLFQARGIVNTRAIQHNLDWIWPYWVERQFNPRDPSFVPRAFSLSHINLTQRNWTAVSLPDADLYSLVDPRGLVTPLHDGWSIDAWILCGKAQLVPSRCPVVHQTMQCEGELAIETGLEAAGCRLTSRVEMQRDATDRPLLRVQWHAEAPGAGVLCVSLRPYNPEGVQFIDAIRRIEEGHGWRVNDRVNVRLDREPATYCSSNYREGDVFNRLDDGGSVPEIRCTVGMATAAAVFPLDDRGTGDVALEVPVRHQPAMLSRRPPLMRPRTTWKALDARTPVLDVPDERMMYLYRAACRTLLSLSAGDIYPGSYTYRRFWFRDACIMLHALLTLNHEECCRRAFDTAFPRRQTVTGFFESQQGEWDSNGQVLWLAGRYTALTGKLPSEAALKSLRKGADWIGRKRLPETPPSPHAGLLPSGFSAEHLGPNNYYYWDNFWGVAGLRGMRDVLRRAGDDRAADNLDAAADRFLRCIDASVAQIPETRCGGGIPAAPSRRMDAGAIGSIVADYPLRLVEPSDPRILRTVAFLLETCMIDNGFFHDMTHSGINAYLTLHLAQVLLRAGDARYAPLVARVAELASETGQWPEAIHPTTRGGCMGDGQHGWAAAEWVLMIRGLFLREETGRLVVGAGLSAPWLASGKTLRFGPAATAFGPVRVIVSTAGAAPAVTVCGDWRGSPPRVEAALPGHPDVRLEVRDAGDGGSGDRQERRES